MSRWSNRLSKIGAALTGGFRYLPMEGLPGTKIRIPLRAHRGFRPGAMPDGDLVAFLAAAIPDGGVFLDIGANIGTYSAAIGVAKEGNLRGAAFEPVPETNALLRRTLALNRLSGFRAEPCALSSCASELRFTAFGGGGNNFPVSASDERGRIVARSVTLDEWVAANPELAPHAIKIDVEGHELEVLKGGRDVLRRHRPALVIECHCADWPALGVKGRDVAALLAGCGYAVGVDRQGRPVELEACARTIHALYRRASA